MTKNIINKEADNSVNGEYYGIPHDDGLQSDKERLQKYHDDDDETIHTLEHCPHCGSAKAPNLITEDNTVSSYAVICDASTISNSGGCGAMGGFAKTEELAVRKWNLRSPEKAKPQRKELSKDFLAKLNKVLDLMEELYVK